MEFENNRMNSNAMNDNTVTRNSVIGNAENEMTENKMAAINSSVSTAPNASPATTAVPKPLYTTETTIGKVTYVVSVCRSPNAIGTLKEKMRSIILQTAENNRMREMQAWREAIERKLREQERQREMREQERLREEQSQS